ncbi:hypothetical protein [Clostridioides difficile]|uniref:hypothetical protein n=1 Tax=Clostridioides difficile TaxID=1496 RepID=UPI001035344F|nr:hypothetical protein [Clostridioides difficile]MDM9944100.1 hypothetical protein [Clostridioides difficile]
MNKEIIEKMYSLRYPLLSAIQKYEKLLSKEMKNLDYINISTEETENINILKDELNDIKSILDNTKNLTNSSEECEVSVNAINSYFEGVVLVGIKFGDVRQNVSTWRDVLEYSIRYFAKLDKDELMNILGNRVNLFCENAESNEYRYIPELNLYINVETKGTKASVGILKQLTKGFNMQESIKIIVKSS